MFSSSLKITDTSDFIAPALDCVVVEQATAAVSASADVPGEVRIQRARGVGVTAPAPGSEQLAPVKISLHDCLACSGCVTSAETVLLEQQSVDQFQQMLSDPGKEVVVTLSNQSIASLAHNAGLSPGELARRVAGALKARGARAVFDISVAAKIALTENLAEFVRRVGADKGGNVAGVDEAEREGTLPMLTSSCPGWVLYVEKTHPQLIPYVSTVKSPQAIMGTLIKQFWCASEAVRLAPGDVFHVAVMPCYDKKLEAVREELMVGSVPETDCVLTTGELEAWMGTYGNAKSNGNGHADGDGAVLADLDTLFVGDGRGGVAAGDATATTAATTIVGGADAVESGGYMNFLYRSIFEQDWGHPMTANQEVPMSTGRNHDVLESELQLQSGRMLHFAILNGFRNIQGLVRKMKLNKCVYDYVEVMACPSGCVNGAGQVGVSQGQGQAARDESLRGIREAMRSRVRSDAEDAHVEAQCVSIYRHWATDDGRRRSLFGTSLTATHAKDRTTNTFVPAAW